MTTIFQPASRTHEAPTAVPRWRAVVWDDPVNLMSYVSAVFRQYFGYSAARAEELMMAVHTRGRATVSTGVRERIEAMELGDEAVHFGEHAVFWGKFDEKSFLKTAYHKRLLREDFYRQVTIRSGSTIEKIAALLSGD